MKHIGITGGTGLVGQHISKLLLAHGYMVTIFSRGKKESKGNLHFAQWNPAQQQIDTAALQNIDAIIHLAGAGVVDKRWTKSRRKEILSSRVDTTNFLIAKLTAHAPLCNTFISASASGYYGPDRAGSPPFIESDPPYHDFLAHVCVQWEAAARQAKETMRCTILRLGIVLGREGGAYPQFTGPMKLGAMPILGGGRQMVSWIHVDDLATIFLHALEDDKMNGVYNAVAPHPVTHHSLMRCIAAIRGGMHIPIPVPAWMLQLIMGDASTEVLKSCTVSDEKLLGTGFEFHYPNIRSCIKALEGKTASVAL